MNHILKIKQAKSFNAQKGALLVESMVALAIFSVALLSLSGLQISASKSSFSSMLKTESAVSVSELTDRMRSNLAGVQAGDYDIAFNEEPVATVSVDTIQGERDVHQWFGKMRGSSMLGTEPDAQITCNGLACKIELRWDDSRTEQDLTADTTTDTDFDYVFDINF